MSRITQPRWIIIALTVIAIATIWALIISYQTQWRLRDAVCGTFTDVASSPTTPQTSDLGRKLIADTRHGAQVAHCPKS